MLKRLGIPLIALAAMLTPLAARPAKAGVQFGVSVGVPGYVYPTAPYAYDPYVDPYAYDPYAYTYSYPVVPTYVYPNRTWRAHDRDDWGRRGSEHGSIGRGNSFRGGERNEHSGRRR